MPGLTTIALRNRALIALADSLGVDLDPCALLAALRCRDYRETQERRRFICLSPTMVTMVTEPVIVALDRYLARRERLAERPPRLSEPLFLVHEADGAPRAMTPAEVESVLVKAGVIERVSHAA